MELPSWDASQRKQISGEYKFGFGLFLTHTPTLYNLNITTSPFSWPTQSPEFESSNLEICMEKWTVPYTNLSKMISADLWNYYWHLKFTIFLRRGNNSLVHLQSPMPLLCHAAAPLFCEARGSMAQRSMPAAVLHVLKFKLVVLQVFWSVTVGMFAIWFNAVRWSEQWTCHETRHQRKNHQALQTRSAAFTSQSLVSFETVELKTSMWFARHLQNLIAFICGEGSTIVPLC